MASRSAKLLLPHQALEALPVSLPSRRLLLSPRKDALAAAAVEAGLLDGRSLLALPGGVLAVWLQESLWAHQESWIEAATFPPEQKAAAVLLPLSSAAANAAKAEPSSLEEVGQPAAASQAPRRRASRAPGLLLGVFLLLLAVGGLFRLYNFSTKEEEWRELSLGESAKKQELLRAHAQLQFAAEGLSGAVGTREAAQALGALQRNLEGAEQLLHKVGDPSLCSRAAAKYASLMAGAVEAANQLQGAAREAAQRLFRSVEAPPASSRWPAHVEEEALERFEGLEACAITLNSLQTCCEAMWKQAEAPTRLLLELRPLTCPGDSGLLSAASHHLERLTDLAGARNSMESEAASLMSSTLRAMKSALLLSRRQLHIPLRTEVEMLTVLHRRLWEPGAEAPLPSASSAAEEKALLDEAQEVVDQYAGALRRIESSESLAALQQANRQAVALEGQLKELVGCLWSWWQEAPNFEAVVVQAEVFLGELLGARSAEAAREATETQRRVKQLLEGVERKLMAACTNPHPLAHRDVAKRLLAETRNLKHAAEGRASRPLQQYSSSSCCCCRSPSTVSAGGRRVLALSDAARASLEDAFFAHSVSTAAQMMDLSAAVLELLQRDAFRSKQVHARAARQLFGASARRSEALLKAQSEFNEAAAAAHKAESIQGLAQATARMRAAALDLEALMYESDRQARRSYEGEGPELTTD
ncbi:hypothetical protein Esti_000845 [Eimeria stiedai]